MFGTLSEKLNGVFSKLKKQLVIKEADVELALKEIRMILLDADVALPVVREFNKTLKEKAIGQKIIEKINPVDQIIKIVHEQLIECLGEGKPIEFSSPPSIIMLVGLQGAGKTTTAAKLAYRLKTKNNKKVLLTSLDIYRPAAQEQLAIVAQDAGVSSLEIIEGQKPKEITERALLHARKFGFDTVILDTAGRLHIDDDLMEELQVVKQVSHPKETILVVDSLSGQDAANVAKSFNEKVGLSGLIMTRVDGDSRGGAILSTKMVAGVPIKFVGVGEKISELQEFDPKRIADRILDKGDILSLVEKAASNINEKEMQKTAERLSKGIFTLNDMATQFEQMKKLGNINSLMSLIPGMGQIKKQLANANLDSKIMDRQLALIRSMTKKERENPKIIDSSRKKRIANGSGQKVEDLNRLLKNYMNMQNMMKSMGKKGGLNPAMLGKLTGGTPNNNIFGKMFK